MEKSNFLHSLHWFRGIAIFFVVMGHAVVKLRSDDALSIGLSGFFVNGTLFFVFISGYLFWHLKDRYEYKSYLISKFKYVVLPYIFILGAVLILAFILQQKGISIGNTEYSVSFTNPFELRSGFLWHYFVGGAIILPFWFLPFIFIVFLTSKLIYEISNSKYFIVFFTIFMIISLITLRPILDDTPLMFPILNYFHFLGIFFLGIMMKKNETLFYDNAKVFTFVFLFLFLLVQYISISERISGEIIVPFINTTQLKMLFGVMFFVSFLFLIEKSISNIEAKSNIFIKTLNVLAKYSFAIFFLHSFALKAMEIVLNKYLGGVDNVIGFTILVIGSFIISIFVSWLIKKVVGKKSRMLIGS